MPAVTTALRTIAIAALLVTARLAAAEPPVEADATWRFRVFLDDREIGYHHYYLAVKGDVRRVRSVAAFEYRLLFVKLYGYEHENVETWSGDCLQRIDSQTDANGKPYAVVGRRRAGGFRVDGSAGSADLPDCVMSFAYWNPALLDQERLLNTQNGGYVDVQVSPPVAETLEVHGETIPARRYHLEAGELSLDLWYSTDNRWLALESEVQGGRKLRYELM
jgi:Domain of unknown function (DUF6134)